MYERLRNRTEHVKKEVVQFAAELVQTPSPSLKEENVAKQVERKMEDLQYDQVFQDEFGNVVGILYARHANSTLLLNCHMDTIAPGQEASWTESPYSGKIEGNRLWGVGASDCKGGLAAQIYAGLILKRSLLPLEGNLIVAATVAEENGRSIGVKNLLENTLPEMGLKPDYAVLGEPTGLGLYYGHDGWVEIDIVVEGPNAFHVDDATEAIIEDFNHSFSNGSTPNWGIHPTRFEEHSGSRRAIIPINRRLHESEPLGEVLGQLKHSVGLMAGNTGSVAVEVMVKQENQKLFTGRTTTVQHITNAWSTDPFHPLIERSRQALAGAGCKVQPGKWKLDRLGMGTAGSKLVNEFAVPTIGYGPGEEEVAHEPNEYVEIPKLVESVYGTAAIVHSLIGMPVFGWTSDEI